MLEPVDIEQRLAEPKTYEEAILRMFAKRSRPGSAFREAGHGVTYFGAASERWALSRAIARAVAKGEYLPHPVDLWFSDARGKRRALHKPIFIDQLVGSALFQLIAHNTRCYGLPGVYSYLPGTSNVQAIRSLAKFIRAHRKRVGAQGPPLHVLKSDFERYGENLPIGPGATVWRILREVTALGSPKGGVGPNAWNLITSLARPVVRDPDASLFTRLYGIPDGTPLVPILLNLAVAPMDKVVSAIEGVFYARYGDDFIIAHPDLAAMHEVEARLDSLLGDMGVERNVHKELRVVLSATGQPSVEAPAYRGRSRIDWVGLSVNHAGTITVGPHRLRRFIRRIATRIDAAAFSLSGLSASERARHLVATANVMLDAESPFAAPGLSALLKVTTDRGVLKDLDFRIARKIVQAATKRPGSRGFRLLPPAVLRRDMGLVSLVHLRNLR